MNKKIKIVVIAVGALYLYSIFGVGMAGRNKEYLQAVNAQTASKLSLATTRGTIYDCNLLPLTNAGEGTLGVAMPIAAAVPTVKEYIEINPEEMVKDGRPVTFWCDKKTPSPYIDYFTVPRRYSDEVLCPAILGYVDGAGQGVTGAELAFNEELSKPGGKLVMNYSCDALGRMIIGKERQYENTLSTATAGVALTIDSDIQRELEKAAKKMTKGAAVVVSVPDCEIKASISVPTYDPNNLEAGLNGENSPMMNRAFTAFAPGSVFKLVVAAAALENGADGRFPYTCTGTISVGGQTVSCYASKPHGTVNLHTALQKSCNCYFIQLASRVSPSELTEMAKRLGLGEETVLAKDYSSEKGNIPPESELSSMAAIANFAIGQGDVETTPLQIAAMVNAITSGGEYTKPTIYKGLVNDEKELLPAGQSTGSVSAMEAFVAFRLISYMESASVYGTARDGATDTGVTGAKTGTAQTGVFVDGQELVNYWYAGYVGSKNKPEYVIVALEESAMPGYNPTSEVFKEMGQYLIGKSLEGSGQG